MIVLKGKVVSGFGHFKPRMDSFPEVFRGATGETLFPGTLNVDVNRPIKIKQHFKISGAEIKEPEQDLLFEICRINGIWAYRIRPYNLENGTGGHGDHILEIACAQRIPDAVCGSEVEITLFRESLD